MNERDRHRDVYGFPANLTVPYGWRTADDQPIATETFDDLVDLLEQLEAKSPGDVIIQSPGPHVNTLRLCRVIRQHTEAPIRLVTSAMTADEQEVAFQVGITSIHDVSNGYHAIFQELRPLGPPLEVKRLDIGTLVVDLARRRTISGNVALALTKTEFEILVKFARNPGETISRQELISHVWGKSWFGVANVLDTHVGHLRAKLRDAGHHDAIVTVRGVGWYLEPQFEKDR